MALPLHRALAALAVLAVLAGLPARAERWKLQYVYDEEKTSLTLNDLRFLSPRRGVAVGFISEGRHTRPTAVVTSDGGEHWALTPIKEVGVSLFFLNDSIGWMVTAKGLWNTDEAGRSWRKTSSAPKGLFRVYFLDEKHGFGVGMKKGFWETTDGGDHWKALEAGAEPNTTPEYTSYTWINFANPTTGMVSGFSMPPNRGDDAHLPDWIEPDAAIRRSERPHMLITLETRDGGKTWKPSATTGFGRISRVRFSPSGIGLGLIEFASAFTWPAEVMSLHLRTGKSERVYRDKNHAVTDLWIAPSGVAYLAGVETMGQLRSAIPGKVRILRSDDLAKWTEMRVDYRAVAQRVTMSAVDDRNIWVATDTGMILKLVP